MTTFDVVIKNGLVVDGTGAPGFDADVAVSDGRIAEIGSDLQGRETIDADGCVIAPGLIDIHTHYDAQVTWDPWLDPSSSLGVTSVVGGNCGYTIAPCRASMRELLMRTLEATEDMSLDTLRAGISWDFETYGDYVSSIARRGLGINFGTYVGHTAVRIWAMGDDAYEREATSVEIDRMRAAVVVAIRQGALGFSTNRSGSLRGDGGRPVPSIIATQQETDALCAAVVEAGRGIVSIAAGNDPAYAYDLADRLGCTITWNSILAYVSNTTKMPWRDKLQFHLNRRASTPHVYPQVTCRELVFSFTMINPIIFYSCETFAELLQSDSSNRGLLFADEHWRSRARSELDARKFNWSGLRISESGRPEYRGNSMSEVAAAQGKHPLDAMLDCVIEDKMATVFTYVNANSDVDAVTEMLQSPGCILGLSDAGAHVTQICDAVLPIDFLSRWVRDRRVMPMEAGIRKLTGELADVMGWPNRGYLKPGAHADVAVLAWEDLDVGAIERVRDLPAGGERLLAPHVRGMRHVLVNGVRTRADNIPVRTEVLPGAMLASRKHNAHASGSAADDRAGFG